MKLDVYYLDYTGYEFGAEPTPTRATLYSAVSVSTTEFYNGVGKMTLVAIGSERNRAALKLDSIVYDINSKMTYIIVNVRYDAAADRITANGYSANWLLARRAVAQFVRIPPGYKVGPVVDEVETDVYALVSENVCTDHFVQTWDNSDEQELQNRRDPRISVAASKNLGIHLNDPKRFSYLSADEFPTVLDASVECLEAAGIGHRMNFDPDKKTWEFEIYQGQDKTSTVAFVEEHGTLGGISFEFDSTTFRNVAAVPLFYEGHTNDAGNKIATMLFFGAGEGAERYETILPMQTERSDEGGLFEERVKNLAFKELSKCLSRQTFTASGIDSADLGKKFDLGDLVKCVSNRLGIEFDARITCIRRTFDSRRETVELVLGDPVLTVLSAQTFPV